MSDISPSENPNTVLIYKELEIPFSYIKLPFETSTLLNTESLQEVLQIHIVGNIEVNLAQFITILHSYF